MQGDGEAPPVPLGALGLTPSGLAKVRKAIELASDARLLAAVDKALIQGDLVRLRQLLDLQPEDLKGDGGDDDSASTHPSEDEQADDEDEEDNYDPFAAEPVAEEELVKQAEVKAELEESRTALETAKALLEEAKAAMDEVKIEGEDAPGDAKNEGSPAAAPVQEKAEVTSEGADALLSLIEEKTEVGEVSGEGADALLSLIEEQEAKVTENAKVSEEPKVKEEHKKEAFKDPRGKDAPKDPRVKEEPKVAVEVAAPIVRKAKIRKAAVTGPLAALKNAYSDSDEDETEAQPVVPAVEEPAAKKLKVEHPAQTDDVVDKKALPVSWYKLVCRTTEHPDFRAPAVLPDSAWASSSTAKAVKLPAVSLATSRVYVGDPTRGYDAQHVARVAMVGPRGERLLDVLVRPSLPVLDCRTHVTAIARDALDGESAVDQQVVRQRVLELLTPNTLLIGYKLTSDLEALRLCHELVVDTSLLFAVETRKKHQFHPLRYLAQQVLDIDIDKRDPHDALQSARLAMQLAQHEASKPTKTPPFLPADDTGLELLVRHIPSAWGEKAERRVLAQCPGAAQGAEVRWCLSELDPSEWRGEALLSFPSRATRDRCFEALKPLTDIHVQWEDLPDAPPLGSFLTEQSLIQAFSSFGVVVAARIPRKPNTLEPQPFAFVSFLEAQDAQRAARSPKVEVKITPSWSLPLRPRVAKYGGNDDRRVAVPAGDKAAKWGGLDFIHVCRR